MFRFPRLALTGVLSGVLALVAVTSVAAFAQQRSSPPRPTNPLPAGSYQQTCRGANMNGNRLSAQCPNRQGAPIYSSIDTNDCRGREITNDNGYLRCRSGSGPRPPVPPRPEPPRPVPPRPEPPRPTIPTGDYQRSCRGITVRGNMLSAQCTNRQGRPVSSSLDIRSCRGGDIYNDDGYLRCRSGNGGGGVAPPTGGNFEAILYTSVNYQGQSLRVAGAAPNLAFYPGFNDNVRSIRIIRGRAQVCADSLYRGQCQTIGRSVSDLNRIGMGNRISSVR